MESFFFTTVTAKSGEFRQYPRSWKITVEESAPAKWSWETVDPSGLKATGIASTEEEARAQAEEASINNGITW